MRLKGLSNKAVRRIAQVIVEDYEEDYDKDYVFHTSPVKITNIDDFGSFGDILFFSNEPYVMTASSTYYIYRMELSPNEILKVTQFFYQDNYKALDPIVEEIQEKFNIDREYAEDILSTMRPIPETSTGEDSWYLQELQGRSARLLGYTAAQSEDEQGFVYIVPMSGKEQDLELVEIVKG